jgi:histidine ammonia-lyase
VVRAERIARQADVVAALTVEALQGSARAFHPAIHGARPHSGQLLVAGRVRELLGAKHKHEAGKDYKANCDDKMSEIRRSHINCTKVQDAVRIATPVSSHLVLFCCSFLVVEVRRATVAV